MGKQETIKDKITDMEVSRMWYRDTAGRRYSVIKYADPYGDENRLAEEVPIYVATGGTQPELLGAVLEELRRFRELKSLEDKRVESSITDNLWALQERMDTLEKRLNKKWWKLWQK